jgi:protein tyrosine phosphatase
MGATALFTGVGSSSLCSLTFAHIEACGERIIEGTCLPADDACVVKLAQNFNGVNLPKAVAFKLTCQTGNHTSDVSNNDVADNSTSLDGVVDVNVEALRRGVWTEAPSPRAMYQETVLTSILNVKSSNSISVYEAVFGGVGVANAGHNFAVAIKQMILKGTLLLENSFSVVVINPQYLPLVAPGLTKFSVVKQFANEAEKRAIQRLLQDNSRILRYVQGQSTLFTHVTAIEVINIDVSEIAKSSVSNGEDDDDQGLSNKVTVLICAFLFLAAALGGIYYYHARADSVDLKLPPDLPPPAMKRKPDASGAGVAAEMTQRATGMLFRSEPAPSADNFVVCRLPFNRTKNRSDQHLSYDHTRIELGEVNGVMGSDYINATLIPGYRDTQYIATQGPMQHTAEDFWRMVCEQGCKAIVNMTLAMDGGAEQTFQYWPHRAGEVHALTIGDITVTTINVKQVDRKGYAIREINIQVGNYPKHFKRSDAGKVFHVSHFLFMGFPSTKTPVDTKSFREFREIVHIATRDRLEPVVVHCNNGAGRTGVFLLYDMTMAQYRHSGDSDIFDTLVAIRRCRPRLVETRAQYLFVHRAFLDELQKGSVRVLEKTTPEKSDFLKSFAVPAELRPFDLGLPGRTLVSVDDGLFILDSLQTRVAHGTVAITNDSIMLTSEMDGKQVLQGCGDRKAVAEGIFDRVKGAGPACFGLVLDQLYVLECPTESDKHLWVKRLKDVTGYTPKTQLAGNRMTSFQPQVRKQALNILRCADPQTKEGSDALKEEFDTIPQVFSAGPRTVVKHSNVGKTPLGQVRSRTVLNALYQSSPMQSSEAKTSLPLFATPGPIGAPPQMGEFVGTPAVYGVPQVGRPTSTTFGRTFAVPATPAQEDLLADKLGELEAAIERAAALDYIASGKAPRSSFSDVVGSTQASSRRVPTESMQPPLSVIHSAMNSPVKMPTHFSDRLKAELWEYFQEAQGLSSSVDIRGVAGALRDNGYSNADGRALLELAANVMADVGPQVNMERFESAFFEQNSNTHPLRNSDPSNFDEVLEALSSPHAPQASPVRVPRSPNRIHESIVAPDALVSILDTLNARGLAHRVDVDTLLQLLQSAGAMAAVDRRGQPIMLMMLQSLSQDAQGLVSIAQFAEGFNTYAEGNTRPSRISSPRRTQSFSTGADRAHVPTARHFSIESSRISREDLATSPRQDNPYSPGHVLRSRHVSIPALALVSLKNNAPDDTVFNVTGPAKKRMVRNPTMKTMSYKERPSIFQDGLAGQTEKEYVTPQPKSNIDIEAPVKRRRPVQVCTFLGNCDCPKCS